MQNAKEMKYEEMMDELKAESEENRIFFTVCEYVSNIVNTLQTRLIDNGKDWKWLAKATKIKYRRVVGIMSINKEPTIFEIAKIAVALDLKLIVQEEEKK